MRGRIAGLIVCGTLAMAAGTAEGGMVRPFHWSGLPIVTSDDPTFHPDVTATFELTDSGDELILTLTYNGGNDTVKRLEQVFSGLIWDLDGFGGTLEAISASIDDVTQLVDADPGFDPAAEFGPGTDVSGHFAFATDIDAGTSPLGPVGRYGVGAVGDINGELDTFGPPDLIDGSLTDDLEPNAPNGGAFTLVPTDVDLTFDGLPKNGPYIQNSVEITLAVDGDLSLSQITNVQPFFGTNSDTLAPEPGSMSLLAIGLVGLLAGGSARRFRWKKRQGADG